MDNIQRKIFIVVNVDSFFLSHRKELALAANKKYKVTIVAKDTGSRRIIEQMWFKFIDLPLDRSGMNPFTELITFFFLFQLYKREKPDLVHHVGLKVILWGTLAAKMTKVRSVVNAVSGLGVFFSNESKSIFRQPVLQALKFGHNREKLACIFQNNEDKDLFIKNKIIRVDQADFVKGSGVDLVKFNYTQEPSEGKVRILFTGRMIKEKGVLVLFDAAQKLKPVYYSQVEFLLCGGVDENPSALTKEELNALCDGDYFQWLGFRTDVLRLLKKSHIVAFPSYYKEGLPKSLIEAAAVGRPIITTDSTGCRDTVVDGENGFLIPIKDSNALADKLSILIDNKALRVKMGERSRELAEKYFSLDKVIEQHLEIYKRLLE